IVAAIYGNWVTARAFSGNVRRARACRRGSFAANILALSGLTPSTASISLQADADSGSGQETPDRAGPVRTALLCARDPSSARSANRSQPDVPPAPPAWARLRNQSRAPV